MCVNPSNSEKALLVKIFVGEPESPWKPPIHVANQERRWGTLHSVLGAGDLCMVPATTSLGPLQSTKVGVHYYTMVLMLLEAGTANYCLQSKPPTLFQRTLQSCGRVGRQDSPPSFYRQEDRGPERGRESPKSSSEQPKTRPGPAGPAHCPDTNTSTGRLHPSPPGFPLPVSPH